MTSSRLFSKGRRLDFRRDMVWFIIYLLIFFFALPVAYLFGIDGVSARLGEYESAALKEAMLHRALISYSVSRIGMGVSTVFLCLFGALEAYHEFGYLHSRTALDFYHALPGTRKQQYFARILNGFGMVFVPYLICEILTVLLAFGQKIMPAEICGIAAAGIALNLLLFALTYFVFVTVVMLTGKALTCVLGMAVFTGYFPALFLLLTGIPQAWFRTYVSGTMSRWPSFLQELSPAIQAAHLVDGFLDGFTPGGLPGDPVSGFETGYFIRIAAVAAAAVLFLFAALWLYKRRALERCGEAMAFPKTESPIRNMLVVLAGIAGMLFMKELGRTLGWILFGTVAAVILSHLLIELIYRSDARKLFGRKWQMIILAVLGVLLVVALRFDIFGIDRYIPDEEKVETADLTFGGQDDIGAVYRSDYNGDYMEVYGISGGSEAAEYLSRVSGTDCFDGAHSRESIAAVRRIAEEGLSRMARIERDDAFEDEGDVWSCTITWKMKNGQYIRRCYSVALEKIRDDYSILFDDPEYRASRSPAVLLPSEDISSVYYRYMDNAVRVPADPAELQAAYAQDLAEMTFAGRGKAYPVGLLEFGLPEDTLEKLGYSSRNMETRVRYYMPVPVYPSFRRTLAVLEAAGFDAVPDPVVAEAKTAQYEYWFDDPSAEAAAAGPYTKEIQQVRRGVLTDPEDIRIVKEALVSYRTREYNIYGTPIAGGFTVYFGPGDSKVFDPSYEQMTAYDVVLTPEVSALLERIRNNEG